MALSKGLKVLNGFQTAGFAILKTLAAIISIPYAIITAIPNYLEQVMGNNYTKDSLSSFEKNIFTKAGGNELTFDYSGRSNKYIIREENPKQINFLARIPAAIFSSVIFAITAPFLALKDMFTNIIDSLINEKGISKLKCIPLLITGLIKLAASPLRGLADGLTSTFLPTKVNGYSSTYSSLVQEKEITNPIAQAGLLITSPVIEPVIKTFTHIYKATKAFNESNADFLEKRDRINKSKDIERQP